ncbi:NACHT, LRR and PYD domains-containing protein 3-like isoform X2 [Pygocentrus nattereri]|uniref:NACHT, LRR and PYD domains-containing protein 3-like isoform X2 n=1 Tax=Pygocentrus nattereri TaxID=42514 RepID=UPI00189169B6|nr:NACHT, LRR and PYD domains-containing protein 3-like isoform X2 [Pygocentrus nattereri]
MLRQKKKRTFRRDVVHTEPGVMLRQEKNRCASMERRQSKDDDLNSKDGSGSIKMGSPKKMEPNLQNFTDQQSFKKTPDLCRIFSDLENKIIVFIKNELERFRKILTKENTKHYEKLTDDWCSAKEGALNLALHFLKKMKHDNIADALETNELVVIRQCELKSNMKNKYTRIFEGIAQKGGSTLLNKIYTDLYITEGVQKTIEKSIQCNDMFEALSEEDKPIRTVMTQGIAGIGKSVSVQKFILEWANGTKNQRIKFIFPLRFRELNLKEGKHSLMDILNRFFPETKGLRFREKYKVMFIFDGLDECRLPLNFKKNEHCADETQKASLDVLLTNLIKGNLLPSALIWITTTPAAASMIPAEFIDRVTEVRGFNDEQKEEYFRKKISDQDLAIKIIDHIKESRSLHIMCHIPYFCWISATVLEQLLKGTQNEDTPKTLTQMYTRFLIFQTVQKNQKSGEQTASDVPWDKEGILALGKLAFQHLEKNNLIFDSEDLRECGIEISETSVYSGVCTQETGMFLGTVYSFVHLSIQEFIAALYAYVCLNNDKKNVFSPQNTSQENGNETIVSLLKTAVDKALESDKGHLDLFLRFLLGLSLETNQVLIRGLLTQTGSSSDSNKEIIQYIKDKFGENPSPERSINLFYCLNELNDRSLVQEMQKQMKDGTLSMNELSPAEWSALVFVLLTSEEELEVFDLKKFIGSDECLKKLLPVVETAKIALLNDCKLTETNFKALVKPLSSESSKLIKLDLSDNALQDSGLKLLSAGLSSKNCKLEELSINNCGLTEESCQDMARVFSLEHSMLKSLELSKNNLQDSGVQRLAAGLEKQQVKIKNLRLCDCSITEQGCAALVSALKFNYSSHLTELDLSENKIGVAGVEKLSVILKNYSCKLEKLMLSYCHIAGEGYAALASALKSNPSSHLRELDLRGNHPGDTGVKELTVLVDDTSCKLKTLRLLKSSDAEEACDSLTQLLKINPLLQTELDLKGKIQGDTKVKQLSLLLEDSHCRLQKLGLSDCSITGNGYAALASALKSNSSHLTELDLRGNDPGDTGVQKLTDVVDDPKYKLKTLRLLKSDDAVGAHAFLFECLKKEPLVLTELNLSKKKLGSTELKQLSALLVDSHCKLKTLRLNECDLTEKSCEHLAKVLSSKDSKLTELDLSNNHLGDPGVKELSTALRNSHCKLETLRLSECRVGEKGYAALASDLKSNKSSVLKELDLRGNDPGDKGVELIRSTSLRKIRLLKNHAADEAHDSLTKAFGKDPLLLSELDLKKYEPRHAGVEQICGVLEDSHCRLKTLKLYKSGSITERDCAALVSALTVNLSQLRELDLNKNKLDKSGVQKLCSLLKNPHCKLEKLTLNKNNVTSKDCADLASALSSSLSHLRELDLSENVIQDSGLKHFCDVLKTQECKLEKLLLMSCGIKEEGCAALVVALKSNSSHLKVLDLRENSLGNSVKDLAEVLKDSKCNIQLGGVFTKIVNSITGWLSGGGTDSPQTTLSGVDEESGPASSGVYGERLAPASSGLYRQRPAPASGGADMCKEARTTRSLAEQTSEKGSNYGTGH